MTTKIASLSLSLLLAGALTVLAQSPTTSAPTGQGATQDPYGATMDHPNPGSVAAPSSATSNTTATDNSTPNNSTATTPSSTDTSSTTTTTTTTSGTTDSSNNTAATSTDATTPSSMPKTGSDLPLLFAIGCLALAGACGLRATRSRI